MKRAAAPVSVRSGNLEFLRINSAVWEWRDLYHWLLSLSWPRFGSFIVGCYLAMNLGFAGCYLLVPGEIVGLPRGSFADAFFFSVETLSTVGYGHMYPVGFHGHVIATTEILAGMFGTAVITGLIFVRFSRPTANLVFSRPLVVTRFDGNPTLMMRIANQRHQPMAEAKFRIMMIRYDTTLEGEDVARFYELPLQVEGIIIFPAALTIRHTIDERSPLHGMTSADLEKNSVAFMASVVCVDMVVPAAVQSQTSYTWRDVRFGERFVEIYRAAPGEGRWVVDYGKLHDTEPSVVDR